MPPNNVFIIFRDYRQNKIRNISTWTKTLGTKIVQKYPSSLNNKYTKPVFKNHQKWKEMKFSKNRKFPLKWKFGGKYKF